MSETWAQYTARRRAEGWRWGWELNDQIKTDPSMIPPSEQPLENKAEPMREQKPKAKVQK